MDDCTNMSFSNLDRIPKKGVPGQTEERSLYDNSQRYKFTNIDDEEFVCMWNGEEITRIPAGASVTLPESQAITYAKDLCTRVMTKEERAKFVPNMREATWEESQKTRVGLPMARDPYEKRILSKLNASDETPEIQLMKAQIKDQLLSDMSAQVSTDAPTGPKATADLSLVGDKRLQRKGHEFEGVTALK